MGKMALSYFVRSIKAFPSLPHPSALVRENQSKHYNAALLATSVAVAPGSTMVGCTMGAAESVVSAAAAGGFPNPMSHGWRPVTGVAVKKSRHCLVRVDG